MSDLPQSKGTRPYVLRRIRCGVSKLVCSEVPLLFLCFTMFTKQEQRTWLKIQYARGHTERQCLEGLVKPCGDAASPYRTVARWVRIFNEGRDNVEQMARPGRPSVSEEDVETVSALLDTDRRLTVRELALEIGLSHMTVFRIVKKRLGMRKIASRWVPWDLTEA